MMYGAATTKPAMSATVTWSVKASLGSLKMSFAPGGRTCAGRREDEIVNRVVEPEGADDAGDERIGTSG